MIQLWDDDVLAKELKNNALTEKDKLFYLVTLFIIELLCIVVGGLFRASFPETSTWGSPLEAIFSDIVLYSLLILVAYNAFKENLKGDGINFIERFICLSVPCGNKAAVFMAISFVILLIGSVAIGFIEGVTGFADNFPKEAGDWILTIVSFLFLIPTFLYYTFRMNKMFKIASGQME